MLELIKGDILTVFFQYYKKNFDIALLAAIAAAAVVGGYSFFKHKKTVFHKDFSDMPKVRKALIILLDLGKKGAWFLCCFLFFFYFCFLMEITILTREAGTRTGVTLQFMGTWNPDIYSQCYMVENILLFLPFGLFFVLLWRKSAKVWKLLVFSLFLSLFIETVQFLTGRGYFQADDIWLNMLGGLLGGDAGFLFWELGSVMRLKNS